MSTSRVALVCTLVFTLSGAGLLLAQAAPLPDLVVRNIVVEPRLPGPHDWSFRLDVHVANVGDAPAAGTINVMIFSFEPTVGCAYFAIGSIENGLAPNEEKSASIFIPNSYAVGVHRLWVWIDGCSGGGMIEESNEDNNLVPYDLTIVAPDLSISEITVVTADPRPGQPVLIDVRLHNAGSRFFSSFAVGTYAHSDTEPTLATPGSGPLVVSEIGADTDVVLRASHITYANAGTYRFWAWADWGLRVPESDETNNKRSQNIRVGQPPQPGVLSFVNNQGGGMSYEAREGDGAIRVFRLARTGGSDGEVTATLQAAGSATQNADYRAPTQVTLAPGQTGQDLDLEILDDAQVEGDEDVILRLAGATGGATIGTPDEILVLIRDNDAPPAGVVRFRDARSETVESWSPATIYVERVDGNVGQVGVSYRVVAGGSATAGEDYTPVSGTLVWPDGDWGYRLVEVPILDSPEQLEPTENVFLELFDLTGGAVLGTQARHELRIFDSFAGRFQLEKAGYSVDEAPGKKSREVFVVRTESASGPASVHVWTQDGQTLNPANVNAVAGQDYVALDQFVDFADGETRKSVVIAIVNDTIPEYDEHFSVLLRAAPYALGEPAEAEITIYSDETPTPGPLAGRDNPGGSMPFVVEIANGSARYATFSRVPFAWTSNAARSRGRCS